MKAYYGRSSNSRFRSDRGQLERSVGYFPARTRSSWRAASLVRNFQASPKVGPFRTSIRNHVRPDMFPLRVVLRYESQRDPAAMSAARYAAQPARATAGGGLMRDKMPTARLDRWPLSVVLRSTQSTKDYRPHRRGNRQRSRLAAQAYRDSDSQG